MYNDKISFKEWQNLRRTPQKEEAFLKIPFDLFCKEPSILSEYTSLEDLSFPEWKAAVLLLHFFSFVKESEELEMDPYGEYTLNLTNFTRFDLPRRIKETHLDFYVQYGYQEDKRVTRNFLRVPYTVLNKAKGRLAVLIEGLIRCYYVNSSEVLWRLIYSLYGTKEFKRDKVERYWNSLPQFYLSETLTPKRHLSIVEDPEIEEFIRKEDAQRWFIYEEELEERKVNSFNK